MAAKDAAEHLLFNVLLVGQGVTDANLEALWCVGMEEAKTWLTKEDIPSRL